MQTDTRNAQLEELVIEALTELTHNAPPSALGTDSYFKIEVIHADDVELDIDIAVTGRFMRWSTPYERVDLDAGLGSPPFAQAAETVAFDKQWFDDADDAVAAIAATEEPVMERSASWTWLAISVAVAGLAVAVAEYLI